jgi:hypothetical protein
MKHTRMMWMIVVGLTAVFLTASLALADGDVLPRSLVSSGGSVVSESGFTLHSAIGQPAAGAVANGPLLCSGYLCGTGVLPDGGDDGHSLYLPSVVRQ